MSAVGIKLPRGLPKAKGKELLSKISIVFRVARLLCKYGAGARAALTK